MCFKGLESGKGQGQRCLTSKQGLGRRGLISVTGTAGYRHRTKCRRLCSIEALPARHRQATEARICADGAPQGLKNGNIAYACSTRHVLSLPDDTCRKASSSRVNDEVHRHEDDPMQTSYLVLSKSD